MQTNKVHTLRCIYNKMHTLRCIYNKMYTLCCIYNNVHRTVNTETCSLLCLLSTNEYSPL